MPIKNLLPVLAAGALVVACTTTPAQAQLPKRLLSPLPKRIANRFPRVVRREPIPGLSVPRGAAAPPGPSGTAV